MLQNITAIVNIVLAIAVLLVGLGRWGGKLEARRGQSSPAPGGPGSNGTPSNGELHRRLVKLEDDRRVYVRRRELEETLRLRDESLRSEREQVWGAIKGLRDADGAITRRVDSLLGQG